MTINQTENSRSQFQNASITFSQCFLKHNICNMCESLYLTQHLRFHLQSYLITLKSYFFYSSLIFSSSKLQQIVQGFSLFHEPNKQEPSCPRPHFQIPINWLRHFPTEMLLQVVIFIIHILFPSDFTVFVFFVLSSTKRLLIFEELPTQRNPSTVWLFKSSHICLPPKFAEGTISH